MSLLAAIALPNQAAIAGEVSDTSEISLLKAELTRLNQRYDAQSNAMLELANRLRQLENSAQPRIIRAAATTVDEPASVDNATDKSEVVKTAPPARSAQNIYREQNVLFNKTFSIETGITYSHSDRRELILDGFLALDAIFLGNIKLDRIKSDILQFDATARYGITDRLQFDFNAPFLYRRSTFQSGGVGGSASTLGEVSVNQSDIGDISAGAYYRVFRETPTSPDVVMNLRVKAPTGKNPFGIKIIQPSNNPDLTVPEKLPTGNGVWSLSGGLTVVKTVDPAILFANIGYTHNFARKFDDISSAQGIEVPGEVTLGDSIQLGGGIAFALNDRMSLSTSYSHQFAQQSSIKQSGGTKQKIIGSDSSSGSLNFGVTYVMTDRLSMVTNVGMGITPDAPDVSVGIKFPYSF